MSTETWDTAQSLIRNAEYELDFLCNEDGSFKEHSIEEFRDRILSNIESNVRGYIDLANEHGWIDEKEEFHIYKKYHIDPPLELLQKYDKKAYDAYVEAENRKEKEGIVSYLKKHSIETLENAAKHFGDSTDNLENTSVDCLKMWLRMDDNVPAYIGYCREMGYDHIVKELTAPKKCPFENILSHIGKRPVEGEFPPKPQGVVSVYKALNEYKRPINEDFIEMFHMPTSTGPKQGYEYVRLENLVPMTLDEKKEWDDVLKEKKEAQNARFEKIREEKKAAKEESLKHPDILKSLEGKVVVCLDTETTGFSYKDEVLQLSIFSYEAGNINEEFSEFFKPRFHSNWDEAMKINGITPAMVEEKHHITDYGARIANILKEADYIVGYNIGYDIRMLKQDLGNEIDVPEEKLVDVCKIFKGQHPDGNHSLTDAVSKYCEDYKIWFEEHAHDATADTIMTFRVLEKMVTNEGAVMGPDVNEKEI